MLLGLETFTVVGLVVGFCLWMALLLGVRQWGPAGEGRGAEKPEREPAADAESPY